MLPGAERIVMLEGINDHENLGAIARTARGLGADALVLDPTCADPFYRRSVRVSMGELLHLPIVRCDIWAVASTRSPQRASRSGRSPRRRTPPTFQRWCHRPSGRWSSAPKVRG